MWFTWVLPLAFLINLQFVHARHENKNELQAFAVESDCASKQRILATCPIQVVSKGIKRDIGKLLVNLCGGNSQVRIVIAKSFNGVYNVNFLQAGTTISEKMINVANPANNGTDVEGFLELTSSLKGAVVNVKRQGFELDATCPVPMCFNEKNQSNSTVLTNLGSPNRPMRESATVSKKENSGRRPPAAPKAVPGGQAPPTKETGDFFVNATNCDGKICLDLLLSHRDKNVMVEVTINKGKEHGTEKIIMGPTQVDGRAKDTLCLKGSANRILQITVRNGSDQIMGSLTITIP